MLILLRETAKLILQLPFMDDCWSLRLRLSLSYVKRDLAAPNTLVTAYRRMHRN